MKLKSEDKIDIIALLEDGYSKPSITKKFCVSLTAIKKISRQYQMKQYRDKLESKGIRQSMSRKGNCYDNCVMENFFGFMKNEMFYGIKYND